MKVPMMGLAMGIPMRAAVATSSLMLGVTACAGAVVYLARGFVDPAVAVPIVLGVIAGAYLGIAICATGPEFGAHAILGVVLFALASR